MKYIINFNGFWRKSVDKRVQEYTREVISTSKENALKDLDICFDMEIIELISIVEKDVVCVINIIKRHRGLIWVDNKVFINEADAMEFWSSTQHEFYREHPDCKNLVGEMITPEGLSLIIRKELVVVE